MVRDQSYPPTQKKRCALYLAGGRLGGFSEGRGIIFIYNFIFIVIIIKLPTWLWISLDLCQHKIKARSGAGREASKRGDRVQCMPSVPALSPLAASPLCPCPVQPCFHQSPTSTAALLSMAGTLESTSKVECFCPFQQCSENGHYNVPSISSHFMTVELKCFHLTVPSAIGLGCQSTVGSKENRLFRTAMSQTDRICPSIAKSL